jgi:hypothetical protein
LELLYDLEFIVRVTAAAFAAASTAIATATAFKTIAAAATVSTAAIATAITTAAAAVATTVTTAETSAIATTATTAAEARAITFCTRTCLVHDQVTAVEILAIGCFNGLAACVVIGHFNETEATAAVGCLIHDDLGRSHLSVWFEEFTEILVLYRVRDVGDVNIHEFY